MASISKFLTLLAACSWLGSAMPAAQFEDPYGKCEGWYYHIGLDPAQLRCDATGCSPGCVKMVVSTGGGTQGRICICNYVGPQPFCCTMGISDAGGPMIYGSCSTAGCPAGEYCAPYSVESLPVFSAHCITIH